MLVDDGSAAVSLPELPLLAVLPGTGGLTRVSDKRKVRRDHADVFCTTEEGVKGKRAVEWRLVDDVVPGSKFDEAVAARAAEFAAKSRAQRRRHRHQADAADAHIRARTASNMARSSVEFQRARAASPPSPCAAPLRRRRLRPTPWWRSARRSGRCSWRANSTTPSCISGSTSSTSRRSSSNRPAIRRRCSLTTDSSTPTRITGSRAKSGCCGSACSSASISPRARWSR